MPEPTTEERWRDALMGIPHAHLFTRRMFSRLPKSPRCKNCSAPFEGAGGVLARAMGFRQWDRNPKFCNRCIGIVSARGIGGAEIEISMLFADLRGSTNLAESMSPSEFAHLLDRFYVAAVDVLVREDAMVDKFVGDEVVALFIPAFAGLDHAKHAIRGAEEILVATGHNTDHPWVPLGVGVHTGVAYVGSVGSQGQVTDVTALGDAVNTTARLASAASAGQILVTAEAASAAGLSVEGLSLENLRVKGKSEPIQTYSLSVNDEVRRRLATN